MPGAGGLYAGLHNELSCCNAFVPGSRLLKPGAGSCTPTAVRIVLDDAASKLLKGAVYEKIYFDLQHRVIDWLFRHGQWKRRNRIMVRLRFRVRIRVGTRIRLRTRNCIGIDLRLRPRLRHRIGLRRRLRRGSRARVGRAVRRQHELRDQHVRRAITLVRSLPVFRRPVINHQAARGTRPVRASLPSAIVGKSPVPGCPKIAQPIQVFLHALQFFSYRSVGVLIVSFDHSGRVGAVETGAMQKAAICLLS